jgi:nucleotide-binding universal stress UspA family protein
MSIFSTKILFATDGSRDAEVTATTAVGLAKATGSELHVVTAAEGTLITKLTGPWPSTPGSSPKRFSTSR